LPFVGWKHEFVDHSDQMLAILLLLLGVTPLSYAIFGCGSASVVRYLLDRGAKPNKTNTDGFTALHFATMAGLFLPSRIFVSVLHHLFCFIFNPRLVAMSVLQ
jgi:hypothetical protein